MVGFRLICGRERDWTEKTDPERERGRENRGREGNLEGLVIQVIQVIRGRAAKSPSGRDQICYPDQRRSWLMNLCRGPKGAKHLKNRSSLSVTAGRRGPREHA